MALRDVSALSQACLSPKQDCWEKPQGPGPSFPPMSLLPGGGKSQPPACHQGDLCKGGGVPELGSSSWCGTGWGFVSVAAMGAAHAETLGRAWLRMYVWSCPSWTQADGSSLCGCWDDGSLPSDGRLWWSPHNRLPCIGVSGSGWRQGLFSQEALPSREPCQPHLSRLKWSLPPSDTVVLPKLVILLA